MTEKMKCAGCDWTGFRCECVDVDPEYPENFDPACPNCDAVCEPIMQEEINEH
jgi:hypothetical protein